MDEDRDLAAEERAIHIIIAVTGVPLVVAMLWHSGPVDTGAMFGIGLVLLGVGWLVRRPHSDIPPARALPRPPR
jgi:hypothetical protein